ncbi:MAG: hypothetical protein MJY74_08475 [Bacteroidaceae bacterium]|nr:hypothetical protein [Bacteroidaceae bacterium]
MKRNRKLITNKYLEFFAPTVLTVMATNFAAIVDAGIVGNLIDSTALSVINILMPVVQFYAAISILFGIAATAIIAGSRGKNSNDFSTGNMTLSVTVISLLVLSTVIMVLQFTFIDEITAFLTPVEEIRPLVREYYLPLIFGTPFMLIMSSLVHIVRTDSRPKFATLIVLVSNTVNLVLDVVLIKFYDMGLTGASLATVIGSIAGLAMIFSHFKSRKCTVHFDSSIIRTPALFGKFLRNVLSAGASGAVGVMLTTAKLLFLNLLIQHYGGKAGMVAFSAVSLCQIVESAFVSGGCQAMVPIVSLLYGEKDYGGIKIGFRVTAHILAVSCIVITAFAELFPEFAAGIYGIRGEELAGAVSAIRITMIMLLGDALTYIFIYFYMCVERKMLSTVFSVVNGIALIIPFGFIMGKFFGINGVWLAMSAAQYSALLLIFVTAVIIKRIKKYRSILLIDESNGNEILSFSANDGKSNMQIIRKEISEKTNSDIADTVCTVLEIFERAEAVHHHKKQTDVRIVNEKKYSIIIKNIGAAVCEDDFFDIIKKCKSFTLSENIGFTYVLLF